MTRRVSAQFEIEHLCEVNFVMFSVVVFFNLFKLHHFQFIHRRVSCFFNSCMGFLTRWFLTFKRWFTCCDAREGVLCIALLLFINCYYYWLMLYRLLILYIYSFSMTTITSFFWTLKNTISIRKKPKLFLCTIYSKVQGNGHSSSCQKVWFEWSALFSQGYQQSSASFLTSISFFLLGRFSTQALSSG